MNYPSANDRKFSLSVDVKDLTNHDELVPFLTNPDGSKLYRILECRFFVLLGTFSF